jgi:hypothetical protein
MCVAVACTSGMAALQRSKELLPPTPAAEGESMARIYHDGSFPISAIS